MAQSGDGTELLGKKVNLLYLIFIILAFLYIPADFVDIFKGINEFYETNSSDNQKLFKYNSGVLTAFDQSDPDIKKLQEDCQITNMSAEKLISNINRYKQELIDNSGGYNNNGYLNKGKNYQITKTYLEDNQHVDSIKMSLDKHAALVKSISDESLYLKIDSSLYQVEFVSSDGTIKNFNKFFFHEVPVSAAVSVLSRIESNILELNNYILGIRLEQLFSENNSLILGVQAEIMNKEYSSSNYGSYIPGEEIIVGVEFLNDNQNTGSLDFNVFDYKKRNNLNIGQYNKSVLELENLPVLYIGINNKITIREKDFPGFEIETELNKGQIQKRGNDYFIRDDSPGIAELKIYGNKTGERILLAEKQFSVQQLPHPIPNIGDRFSGMISTKIFKLQRGIELQYADNNLPPFNIKNFDVQKISSTTSAKQKNNGEFFNSGTRTLIDQANRGDIYLFDNIIAEDFEGKEVRLSTIVLTIN